MRRNGADACCSGSAANCDRGCRRGLAHDEPELLQLLQLLQLLAVRRRRESRRSEVTARAGCRPQCPGDGDRRRVQHTGDDRDGFRWRRIERMRKVVVAAVVLLRSSTVGAEPLKGGRVVRAMLKCARRRHSCHRQATTTLTHGAYAFARTRAARDRSRCERRVVVADRICATPGG
jgi:hypothetical protein